MMTTEYFFSKKSIANSRRRTPSVMNLIAVAGETVASYLIWYETFVEVSDNS